MNDRLPAELEARAILRKVQASGGFATLLRKGDPDRGALTLVVRQRGELHGLLERVMGPDFEYRWSLTEDREALEQGGLERRIEARERFDSDFWLIELDIADAERFVAETTATT